MDLVGYSDSEGSEDEKPASKTQTTDLKPVPTTTKTNFTVNKANPRKIQVRLQNTNENEIDEPAPKRARVGAGAFSGFNSLLPPPKRDADAKTPAKAATRKVFSLKTGAEPGFSRDSDAELRNLFAEEQDTRNELTGPPATNEEARHSIPDVEQPVKGNAFMFKPLSVARGNKKKKPAYATSKPIMANGTADATAQSKTPIRDEPPIAPKKVNLFSIGNDEDPKEERAFEDVEEDVAEAETYGKDTEAYAIEDPTVASTSNIGPQSLHSIATDLNLSKSDRRQLFGRGGPASGTAINVMNFNTDQEYAANEEFRANGEQIQHNPLRSIAPGKHSLKQLVNAATGQKDALEESFAAGRRNKKEAGNKYGW